MGMIRTSEQLRDAELGPVEIEGTARSYKGRAFVVMADGETFCFVADQRDWPDGVEGSTVQVAGELRVEQVVPEPQTVGGLTSQGVDGPSFLVVAESWIAVDGRA